MQSFVRKKIKTHFAGHQPLLLLVVAAVLTADDRE